MKLRASLAAALATCAVCACSSTEPASGSPPIGTSDAAQRALEQSDLPSIAVATQGLVAIGGHPALWWNASSGRVLLETPDFGEELLYGVALRTGLGSNDVGLDRGQLGARHLVRFDLVGDRVLLVAPNLEWRSSSEESAVRQGAREAFAESVLWGFEPLARSGRRTLVDATDFLLRDAHDIAKKLADAGQGSFELDPSRSVVDAASLAGFADNTELDVVQTFTSSDPGGEVWATAAVASAVTFRVHHSFVRLPSSPMPPRTWDPRCGFFSHSWNDVSVPIDSPMERRLVVRHRLELGPDGRVVRPIVYYVDRAAPEPVRTALLEGAAFWEPVFDAAGFPGGFRAELLPLGADPLDMHRNVVTWVGRSTRGWSYGDTVVDPRTGEVLKGHVVLGALRVRQDVLLAEGLLAPYGPGIERDKRVEAMALARIRQLAAHEIGHTLGLAHNFAASIDDRASVMDYPAPRVGIDADARLDLDDAYADGCGAWDLAAVRYGYSVWADEELGRNGALDVLAEMHYLTDEDARGSGAGHPLANLWDDGSDPLDALEHAFRVRNIALQRLAGGGLREGRPLAELEEVLTPLYLHHRFQLDAVAKSLGGATYAYTVAGRGRAAAQLEPVVRVRQLRALALMLETLRHEFLALPDSLREAIGPRPPGSPRTSELTTTDTGFFDPFSLARASIEHTLELLFDPRRAARLSDPYLVGTGPTAGPNLDDVIKAVVLATWGRRAAARATTPAESALHDEVCVLTFERLVDLARDGRAPVRARATANKHLRFLLDQEREAEFSDLGFWLETRLTHYFDDPAPLGERAPVPVVPPGQPIGAAFACNDSRVD